MSHKRVARTIALVLGALLCAVGVLHDVVNIAAARRALAGGEIARRLGPQLIVNIAFAGLALLFLGLFLILIAPDLARGRRAAWRIGIGIGVFLMLTGAAGYWWQPIPTVLIFSAAGAVLCVPLLMWRKEFSAE